jgi:hypothetical protein
MKNIGLIDPIENILEKARTVNMILVGDFRFVVVKTRIAKEFENIVIMHRHGIINPYITSAIGGKLCGTHTLTILVPFSP